jgi:hypothetical protein
VQCPSMHIEKRPIINYVCSDCGIETDHLDNSRQSIFDVSQRSVGTCIRNVMSCPPQVKEKRLRSETRPSWVVSSSARSAILSVNMATPFGKNIRRT